jgi:hypothetical protein
MIIVNQFTLDQPFKNWTLFFPDFECIWISGVQVPHSQCSLRKIPNFCQILDAKITHLKQIFD